MPDEQIPSSGKPTAKRKKTITELAEYHLKNQSHTSTDDEIRNAEVEITGITPDLEGNLSEIDNTTVIAALPGETSENSGKEETKATTPPNPYDVLK